MKTLLIAGTVNVESGFEPRRGRRPKAEAPVRMQAGVEPEDFRSASNGMRELLEKGFLFHSPVGGAFSPIFVTRSSEMGRRS